MINWQTEQLRLTAFPQSIDKNHLEEWWSSIIGTDPTSIQTLPQKGLSVVEGSHDLGKFVFNLNPNKIHLRLIADSEDDVFSPTITTVGDFTSIVDPFVEIVTKWFEVDSCPNLTRLAFGAVLLFHVENRAEGYQYLNDLLPCVDLDPENSSDFIYQINRSRETNSGIKDLKINRLSKWAVQLIRGGIFKLSPDKITSVQQDSSFYIRLELDINTSNEFIGELEISSLDELFRELVSLGIEISTKGDIK